MSTPASPTSFRWVFAGLCVAGALLVLLVILLLVTSGPVTPPTVVEIYLTAVDTSRPEAGLCTDWGINGWGDCGDFLTECGRQGGHGHATHHSGLFPHTDYTCHPGRSHREGD